MSDRRRSVDREPHVDQETWGSLPSRWRISGWRLALASSLSAGAIAVSCGGGQTGDEFSGSDLQEVRGTRQRLVASALADASAASDMSRFAWNFYKLEAGSTENLTFSPYSISTVLAMLTAGAEGETLQEIRAALSFSAEGEVFHQARNDLSLVLDARNRPATETSNAQTLRVSNDFFMLPSARPEALFLDTLSAFYGAGVHLTPFDTEPERSRIAINAKVASDTEQLIPELLPKNSIDSGVVFVMTNAVYFKADWATKFLAYATTEQAFTTLAGTEQTVSMMHSTDYYSYVQGDGYRALSIPYDQGELELVAIMPEAGSFETFAAGMNSEQVSNILAARQSTSVELGFPKFEISSSVALKERLQELGMQRAFQGGQAQFAPMAEGVHIERAFHDARIIVDEAGTEAAAATALAFGFSDVQTPEPIVVNFDQPFIFLIRDMQSGAPLFVGHFLSP